jgi:hypothetical protein
VITNDTARKLAEALRSLGSCTCEYARAGNGVPLWSGAPLQRTLVRQCVKCRALEQYELESRPHQCSHVVMPTVRCLTCLEELKG